MTPSQSLTVAGIMSGTSADGIDVAFVRIGGSGNRPKLDLLAHRAFPFPRSLRRAILAAMNAATISVPELARLNWRLGLAYAEAVQTAMKGTGIGPVVIGCHGQTIYHQGKAARYAGRRIACTWQFGEPALIAAATGIPVVSNFRPADMAAGGQGAPLVPLLDWVIFAHPTRARVLQNIGGIGNLTVIPAGTSHQKLIAFDTGPGNMIIDALMQQLFSRGFDRDGRIAARGTILEPVLQAALRERFFLEPPPKSAGREQFGGEYTRDFLSACRKAGRASRAFRPEDAVTTATALTARSIAEAVKRWVLPFTGSAPIDFIISGGGARNPTLTGQLRGQLEPLGCAVSTSDSAGIPVEAKEAVAFALLAYQTWNRQPGNVPSATGALRPAILGSITYV